MKFVLDLSRITVIAISTVLVGCGQPGPLYLPKKPVPAATPAPQQTPSAPVDNTAPSPQ